jgi:hypothetical protein
LELVVIPRTNVEINWDVDYRKLRAPSADDLDYGGFATRGYAGILVVAATWEEASEWLAREREVVARIGAQAVDDREFDELARDEENEVGIDDPMEGPVAAPELGMFAACLALCAGGCATAASCRGHPGPNAWSACPTILFTADRRRARIVEEAARQSGCALASTDDGRLDLRAPSIVEVLALAELLLEGRDRFEALPLPAAIREARGENAPQPARRPPQPPPEQATLF